MKRFFALPFFLLALAWCAGSASAEPFACLACHSAMQGKVRTEGGALIEVNVDGERYARSVHGGFDCIMCHKQFRSNPHEAVKEGAVSPEIALLAATLAPKAKADPVALASCAECHGGPYKEWQDSVHGRNVIEKKQPDGASCIDCHGSPHYIVPKSAKDSPVGRKNIVKTCGECHENEKIAGKYHRETHVVERYTESFHGKKYALGHPGAPTCVSCHNSHRITQWEDPRSPVAWDNRTKTCGTCHEGATRKFVSAITHRPYGKDNPIPYYFEKGLIVLLLGVFAFVVGHVVLEAFSDIRDKVLRKGKEEHHE
ncbi:MAG: cytochrome c3 family protein [Thermodesulfovibrionales bacterium]